jgi:tetratricopeptide (TPR) repeat protein
MRSSIVSKKTIISVGILLLGSLFVCGDILAYDFTDWYHGASGYEDALDEVIGEEKPLILYFHSESCNWCKKLDSEYLASYEVDQFLSNIPKVEISSSEEALKYYEMSLSFDSENVYAYYAMGLVYHTIGYNKNDSDLLEKAQENYSKALEIDPKHEESRKGLDNLRKNKSQ